MKTTSISVVSALLCTGALAVPTVGHKHAAAHAHLHHKRAEDIVWVTEYEVATVTVVETVYGDGQPASRTTSSTAVQTTSASTTASLTTTQSTTSSAAAAPPASSTTVSSVPTVIAVAPPAPTTAITSSVAPAPEPITPSATTAIVTTPAYVAPAPAAPSSSTAGPVTGSYNGGGSTSAGAGYTGEFTHWEPAMGACGMVNTESEAVVAISQKLFDPKTPNGNPNNNPLCGRKLSLIGKDGSSYSATVVDRCVSCVEGDLDLTLSLFNKVTNDGDGRVPNMKWSWT